VRERGPVASLTVGELLEQLAVETSEPGAGTAAALTAGAAAALVAMAARRSAGSWPEAPGVVAQAVVRRNRCVELAATDAEALAAAVEALDRREDVEPPLRRTVEVLLALADAAADIADLAALTAERCEGRVRADAAAAALLAESAVRVAGVLVRANLTVTPGDVRQAWAERAEEDTKTAVKRALEA
jgi:formiminotetrahydrofolate cyclodeaminase